MKSLQMPFEAGKRPFIPFRHSPAHPHRDHRRQRGGDRLGLGLAGLRELPRPIGDQVDRGDGAGWRLLTYDTTPRLQRQRPRPRP